MLRSGVYSNAGASGRKLEGSDGLDDDAGDEGGVDSEGVADGADGADGADDGGEGDQGGEGGGSAAHDDASDAGDPAAGQPGQARRAQLHAEREGASPGARGGTRGERGVGRAQDQSVLDLRLAAQAEEGRCGRGAVADERTVAADDRGAARSGDPRRVAQAPRAGPEPDPEPAAAARRQGVGDHGAAGDGGRRISTAEGQARAARRAVRSGAPRITYGTSTSCTATSIAPRRSR